MSVVQTQRVFEWVAPKICRDDLPGAEQLPPPSPRRECAPCNPGMDYGNGSSCEPCPRGSWSDGNQACRPCPPGSTPNYGMQVTRWVELPAFMSAACLEPDGERRRRQGRGGDEREDPIQSSTGEKGLQGGREKTKKPP